MWKYYTNKLGFLITQSGNKSFKLRAVYEIRWLCAFQARKGVRRHSATLRASYAPQTCLPDDSFSSNFIHYQTKILSKAAAMKPILYTKSLINIGFMSLLLWSCFNENNQKTVKKIRIVLGIQVLIPGWKEKSLATNVNRKIISTKNFFFRKK